MSGLKPINSLFPNQSSLASTFLGASPASFGSVFDQAMTQATTPAAKAKLTWVRAELNKQNILYGMFSNTKTSLLGFGASDLFGVGGAYGLPSWAYDAQRVLGKNANVQHLMNAAQQAAFLTQSRFNNSLAGLGLGAGVNSLF